MIVLLDTSVALRAMNPSQNDYNLASRAIEILLEADHEIVVVPQVVYKLYVVASRPAPANGLGFSVSESVNLVDRLLGAFPIKADSSAIFDVWRALIERNKVIGKPAHDARLVAAMLVHGVRAFLTFNASDFRRYDSIDVKTPQEFVVG